MSTTLQQVINKINAEILQNTTQDITGDILNEVLKDMANFLQAGSIFGGKIIPSSTPPAGLDSPAFFLATNKGTYTNFNNIIVANNGVHIITFDGSNYSLNTQTNFLDTEGDSEVNLMHQKAVKTFVNNSINTAITSFKDALFSPEEIILSGDQDGSNKTFTTNIPYTLTSSKVWVNKELQRKLIDYEETDENTITFVNAPKDTDILHIEAIPKFN